jgi:RNA polymerase sigma factor (sigma-70 family)
MSAFLDADLPPETLVRARAGEPAALEAVYRAYERPVRTLARRLVANPATAEDLTQDTFVEVLGNLHRYEARGSFSGWVRSIAVSKCLMYLRSPWRRALPWSAGEETLEACAPEARPRRQGGGCEPIDVERALAKLAAPDRCVVWLHDVEGYTHAEIGALLGGTPSLSKSRLARAHVRLRELLEPDGAPTPCMRVRTSC